MTRKYRKRDAETGKASGTAWELPLPCRFPPARYDGLEKRFLKRRDDDGRVVDRDEAIAHAEEQDWFPRAMERAPYSTARHWLWFLKAAIVLLVVSCAGRPVPARPVEQKPAPWCIDAVVLYANVRQSARLCMATYDSCEYARGWLTRWAGRSRMVLEIDQRCEAGV